MNGLRAQDVRSASASRTGVTVARVRRVDADVAVGPGRAAGAYLARAEARARAGRGADVECGEPARFPAGAVVVAVRRRSTGIELYIELI